MIRKINFTNYFSEFIHQVPIKFRFWKALQKKCFQSDIIFRHYVKMLYFGGEKLQMETDNNFYEEVTKLL